MDYKTFYLFVLVSLILLLTAHGYAFRLAVLQPRQSKTIHTLSCVRKPDVTPQSLVQEFDDIFPNLVLDTSGHYSRSTETTEISSFLQIGVVLLPAIFAFFVFHIDSALAVAGIGNPFDGGYFDPAQFQPVCPASDGIYQILKSGAQILVGKENVVQYGPLIASVLLRVRLELCVLESFVYEAVVPFIQQNGLSWILPLHETVETFLAGTIFALASNFILLSSTKILSIVFIYFDALTGFPSRLVGGIGKKVAPKGSAGSAISSGIRLYGDTLGSLRQFLESTDTFVGRYLVILTSIYIAFKFVHFKFFNDIFP